MNYETLDQPVFTLTISEFIKTLKEIYPIPQQNQVNVPQKQFAFSIKESADFFQCSPVTFQKWKNSGFVKYSQIGRKLIIDLPGTLELLGNKKRRA
jgi:hypothetical protein